MNPRVERQESPGFAIDVSSNGDTVWVTGPDGSCVARFSKRFGIDVHRSAGEQLAGAGQCLFCTHAPSNASDWATFCEQVQTYHGIPVPLDTLNFKEGA